MSFKSAVNLTVLSLALASNPISARVATDNIQTADVKDYESKIDSQQETTKSFSCCTFDGNAKYDDIVKLRKETDTDDDAHFATAHGSTDDNTFNVTENAQGVKRVEGDDSESEYFLARPAAVQKTSGNDFEVEYETIPASDIEAYKSEIEWAKCAALGGGISTTVVSVAAFVWNMVELGQALDKVEKMKKNPMYVDAWITTDSWVRWSIGTTSLVVFTALGSCFFCEYCALAEKSELLNSEKRVAGPSMRGNKSEIATDSGVVISVDTHSGDATADVSGSSFANLFSASDKKASESAEESSTGSTSKVLTIVLACVGGIVGLLLLAGLFVAGKRWNDKRRNLDSVFGRSTYQSEWCSKLEEEDKEDTEDEAALMGVQMGHAPSSESESDC